VRARLDFCDEQRFAALGLTRDDLLTNYPGRWERGVRSLMERDDAFWHELMRPAGEPSYTPPTPPKAKRQLRDRFRRD